MPPTLQETIAQLEAALEATHDGVLVLDLDRRVVRFNGRFVEMFRLPADVAARRDADEMIAFVAGELEDPEASSFRAEVLWKPNSVRHLHTLRFKDGRVFERFVAPQRVGDTVVGRVVSYRDVSERVRQAQALEQHRAFLERAQQVAHVGSWVADLDESDRLGWSAETHRIFGVAPDDFARTSAAFFNFVHDDDRAAVHAASIGAIAPGGPPYDIEHRIVRADGTV
ncbi:MAG TPA: PAS domain-containing protein, partial [Vicinamibacterales bacterium]|nr:PAS domain-containing protein [Vicinamibacterales bacterium]